MLLNSKTKNLNYSYAANSKSEFLPIVERESLLIDKSFSFDVNIIKNFVRANAVIVWANCVSPNFCVNRSHYAKRHSGFLFI